MAMTVKDLVMCDDGRLRARPYKTAVHHSNLEVNRLDDLPCLLGEHFAETLPLAVVVA